MTIGLDCLYGRYLRTSTGHGQAVARTGNLMACGRTEYLNDPEAPKPNSLVPAAGVLAVDPDGRVLLQRRRDTGQWAIPMGKQEIGETVTQCAERETREETGVTVKVTGLPVLGGRRRGSGIDSNVSYLAK